MVFISVSIIVFVIAYLLTVAYMLYIGIRARFSKEYNNSYKNGLFGSRGEWRQFMLLAIVPVLNFFLVYFLVQECFYNIFNDNSSLHK